MLDAGADEVEEPLAARASELDACRAELAARERACTADAKRLAQIDEAISKLEDDAEERSRRMEELSSQAASLDIEHARTKTAFEARSRSLSHPGKDAAKAHLAKLEAKLERMQGECRAADENAARLLSLQSRQLALLDAIDDMPEGETADEDGLRERREGADARASVLSRDLSAMRSLVSNHESCLDALEALRAEADDLEARLAPLDFLARLGSGKAAGNLGKVSFETYVQGVYFDRVLGAANERLNVMSAGRYGLVRRGTGRDRRSSSGLEIDVFDRYTGARRPSETLSGGETFLASLSLALGLSDVIMEQAGGMHIDAMFVDEGFGTLDEEACQLAIDVLGKLSADDRMIGIISHVPELRDRIARQIHVRKTRSGSTLDLDL